MPMTKYVATFLVDIPISFSSFFRISLLFLVQYFLENLDYPSEIIPKNVEIDPRKSYFYAWEGLVLAYG